MQIVDPNKPIQYASQFNTFKKKTAQSYIAMAKVVVEAKHGLGKEQYSEFIKLIGYDTKDSTIGKLYRIGLQADLFEKYIDLLPASFTTLYALTTAGEAPLTQLFEERQIRPSLKGCEISQLIKKQARYKRSFPLRKASNQTIVEVDEPLTRGDEIKIRVLPSVSSDKLVMLLKKLEILINDDEEIRVLITEEIVQRLGSREVSM